MTNRFEYVYLYELGVNAICDNNTRKHIPLSNKIADKLNELNDENKELKARCEEYRKLSVQYKQKYDEKISDNTFLEKENEQLKQRIKELEIENTAQSDAIDGLQATLTHFDLEEVIK